jgi:hypothetical protein
VSSGPCPTPRIMSPSRDVRHPSASRPGVASIPGRRNVLAPSSPGGEGGLCARRPRASASIQSRLLIEEARAAIPGRDRARGGIRPASGRRARSDLHPRCQGAGGGSPREDHRVGASRCPGNLGGEVDGPPHNRARVGEGWCRGLPLTPAPPHPISLVKKGRGGRSGAAAPPILQTRCFEQRRPRPAGTRISGQRPAWRPGRRSGDRCRR